MTPHEDYADVIPLDEFKSYCEEGSFIPYDGIGFYGTETHHGNVSVWSTDIIPEGTTHVAWYNR